MITYGRSIRWFNNYNDEVSFSKKNNFDFMQIWYSKGEIILEDIPEPKIDSLISADFPVIIHALLHICEFEEHIPKLITLLKSLSHKEIIIHPICDHSLITENTIYQLRDAVSKASDLFKENGILLYLENNSMIDPINYSIKDISLIYTETDAELLLDLAHIDSYDHLKEIVSIKHPGMIHISDKHFAAEHEHLPIGHGDLDFEYIFKKIIPNFDGKIIFEVVDEDAPIIASLNKIKNILN